MKILVIEDDSETAQNIRKTLTTEYCMDQSDNLSDARYLARQFEYAAIVLDLGLPDGDGLQLLRHWRQEGVDTPVLILTGRDAWYQRVDGLKAGADDYLGKPFHSEELLARIQALIRRAHGESQPTLVRGHLLLDENRQGVKKDGKKIELTSFEYRLLRYFMLHPGQVLSKVQLENQLYDLERGSESNVLEVYIRRLRQKIGAELIVTRRGQGYLFHPEL